MRREREREEERERRHKKTDADGKRVKEEEMERERRREESDEGREEKMRRITIITMTKEVSSTRTVLNCCVYPDASSTGCG